MLNVAVYACLRKNFWKILFPQVHYTVWVVGWVGVHIWQNVDWFTVKKKYYIYKQQFKPKSIDLK